jgi:hypothetical protein
VLTYMLGCPRCKSTEQLATIETITGLAGVAIEQLSDGCTDHRWSGSTDVIWDTSTSVGIQSKCGWEYLGTDYTDKLELIIDEVSTP